MSGPTTADSSPFSLSPQSWNTFYPSFCDVQLDFIGIPANILLGPTAARRTSLVDVRSLSYSDRQDNRFLHGASNTPLARVGRTLESGGEIVFGLITYTSIIQQLYQIVDSSTLTASRSLTPSGPTGAAPGGAVSLGRFGDITFDLLITYQLRPGSRVIQDVLRSCRFSGSATHTQVGGASITVACSLSIAAIQRGTTLDNSPLLTDFADLRGGGARRDPTQS